VTYRGVGAAHPASPTGLLPPTTALLPALRPAAPTRATGSYAPLPKGHALQDTLVEHAAGTYRVLMTLAGDLLLEACERELSPIDTPFCETVHLIIIRVLEVSDD
jgi:hypothetical protein